MKMIWKLLGAAVVAAGLTPYRVEKDDETGETKYRALLWQATRNPRGGEKGALDINIGFKKPGAEEDEAHLFSDELCVEYTGAPVTERSSPVVPDKEEEPAEEDAPAAEEMPAVEEVSAEAVVAPAEEAPAEAAEEETTEDA